MLLFILAAYSLYFWKRKLLIGKFESRMLAQRSETERVQGAIERWMKLYYCERDKGVFLPGVDRLVPISQISQYLMEALETHQ